MADYISTETENEEEFEEVEEETEASEAKEDHRLIETGDQEDFEEEEDVVEVEEETETETDEEEEEEEEEYEDAEEAGELIPPANLIPRFPELNPVEATSHSVSSSAADGRTSQGAVVANDDLPDNSNDSVPCEGNPGNQESGGGGDGRKEASSTGQIDGLFCPICYQPWTSGGVHQICCLPCGHLYGFCCIKKWLQRSPNSRRCPQCNGFCTLKDVRVLYAARLCVVDEQLHKEFIDYVRGVHRGLREKVQRQLEERFSKLKQETKEEFKNIRELIDENLKKLVRLEVQNWIEKRVNCQNQQQNANDTNTSSGAGGS